MPNVIIDTDAGVDDALAILLALRSPEIELIGLTTVAGNAPLELTTVNALRLLEAMDVMDVPVARGADGPLVRVLTPALHIHGADGMGETDLPQPARLAVGPTGAAEFIAAAVRARPAPVRRPGRGRPPDQRGAAFLAAPDLPGRLQGVAIMGGAFALTPYGHGNVTAVSEFNVWADPEAADIVVRSGARVTAVGLDVTTSPGAILTPELHARLAESGDPAGRLAAQVTRLGLSRRGRVQLHDPLTIAAIARPDLVETTDLPVEVILSEGTTRGQTVADRRQPPPAAEAGAEGVPPTVSIAAAVADPDFKDLFIARLTGGGAP